MTYEVLGIGAPLIDHILHVSHEYISRLDGPTEGMELVSPDDLKKLLKNTPTKDISIPGGSTLNTLRGLSRLGISCGFVGSIGQDNSAQTIKDTLVDHKIVAHLHKSTKATGEVLCFVTPDGKRTFRTYYGASTDLKPQFLQAQFFQGAKLVHLEGYTIANDVNICLETFKRAKEEKVKISLDLSNFEVVLNNKELYVNLLTKRPDIIFANHDEIKALTGLDPEEGVKSLNQHANLVIGLLGIKGCCVAQKGVVSYYPALPKTPVDTTGAGDLFISGFLFGHLRGKDMATCARYGAILGSYIVQVEGAEIPKSTWKEIIPCV